MNCLDFRRQLLADPRGVASGPDAKAFQEHIASCRNCSQFATDLVGFENSLKTATEIDVPDGLASRVLLRQRMEENRKKSVRPWLALAASLTLGIAVVLGLSIAPQETDIQQLVLQHVNNELHHLKDRHNVSIEGLNQVLRQQGFTAKDLPGQGIHYAGSCQMRRELGAHLVVDSPEGPVTVLIMPKEFVQQRQLIKDKRFQGVIIPTQTGSMAIIGENAGQFEKIEQDLRSTLLHLS